MSDTAFELRSLPDDRDRPRLFLIQLPLRTSRADAVDAPTTVAQLDGAALQRARPSLRELLGEAAAGAPTSPEQLGDSDVTLGVDEDVALRLGLIFNAINRLRSEDKMETIIDGIAALDPEVVRMWSRMMADDPDAAQKSLNTFLLARS